MQRVEIAREQRTPIPLPVKICVGILGFEGLMMAILAVTLAGQMLSTRGGPDAAPDAMWIMVVAAGYFAVTGGTCIYLILKRSRAGWWLAWTVFPGLLWTALCLVQRSTREYVGVSRPRHAPRGFEVVPSAPNESRGF